MTRHQTLRQQAADAIVLRTHGAPRSTDLPIHRNDEPCPPCLAAADAAIRVVLAEAQRSIEALPVNASGEMALDDVLAALAALGEQA